MTSEHQRVRDEHKEVLIEGKYRLLEELGRGGMGTVFRALDVSLDRTVAVKFLRPQLQADNAFVSRFRREAKAMAQVHHVNVLQIFAYGVADGVSYFVMEYIDGQTVEHALNQLADRRAHLSLDDALALIEQAAAGLGAIHGAEVVHRDIKPANIIVAAEDGRAVIMDFGIGGQAKPGDFEAASKPMGTPAYMAPETVLGKRLDAGKRHLSDIYAFGVTAFEILTGVLPFDSESWVDVFAMHVDDDPPPPSEIRTDLPSAIDEIVLRCLEKQPEARYQTCEEIRRDIAILRSEEAEPPIPRDSSVLGSWENPKRTSTIPPRHSSVGPIGVRVVVAAESTATRYAFYPQVTDILPGCQFVAAKSNAAALEMCRAEPPFLLVASLQDLGMNGIELAATIRGDPGCAATALVLLADRVTASERRILDQLGVFRVVLTPPDEAEIAELLVELSERSATSDVVPVLTNVS